MLVLVVDSSTPAVTAAIAEITDARVAVLAELTSVDARAHGELLAPHVTEVLTRAGAQPRDLAAIVAGLGPGPYTGLRVGLVTAASMGQALAVPTYGVCSLDALGRAAGAGRVLAATDARRREVYWAGYADGVPVTGPAVDRPADLVDRLAELGLRRAVGEGARLYAEQFGLPVDDALAYPPAAALAELAAPRVLAGATGERLTPLYLRRPDAVEPGARKPALR